MSKQAAGKGAIPKVRNAAGEIEMSLCCMVGRNEVFGVLGRLVA